MYRSSTSTTITDADRAAMRRRSPVTLASWKRDAQADDDILNRSKTIPRTDVKKEQIPLTFNQDD